jgi:hypothetical protein
MSRRRAPTDEARVLGALDTILDGAMEASAWAPAIRAAELLGKHIGMWQGDAQPRTSLADMINEAAAKAGDDEQQP